MIDLLLAPTDHDDHVKLHLEAVIVPASKACQYANVWLLLNVGNLLGAKNPELLFLPNENRLKWRVEIWLTRPDVGHITQIGRLDIDASTGEPLASPNLIKTLQTRADHATLN